MPVAAIALFLLGCSDDTVLSQNTAYRRLIDGFATYDDCLRDGKFVDCYQTLTLCANGRVRMTLNIERQDGRYQLQGHEAVASFLTSTVVFDLATESSDQLPGDHPWEMVEPLVYDCDP